MNVSRAAVTGLTVLTTNIGAQCGCCGYVTPQTSHGRCLVCGRRGDAA